MPQQPKWPWVVRDIDKSAVRRIVNELMHFESTSGSFMVVDRATEGKKINDVLIDRTNRYAVYFDDYACGYLQTAWEGWDPEPNYDCGHSKYGHTVHCIEAQCWNAVSKHRHSEACVTSPDALRRY
jgi:hypothetical protein